MFTGFLAHEAGVIITPAPGGKSPQLELKTEVKRMDKAETLAGKRLLTDVESKKQIYGLFPLEPPKPKTDLKEYLTMFQPALQYIAQHPLSRDEQRVFWTVCARLDLQNFIKLNVSNIARDIQMDRRDAGRALDHLVQRGLVEKGKALGNNTHEYKLNATVGWRGTHSQAKTAQAKSNVIRAENRFHYELKSTLEQAATMYAGGATVEEAASFVSSDELRDALIEALKSVASGAKKSPPAFDK